MKSDRKGAPTRLIRGERREEEGGQDRDRCWMTFAPRSSDSIREIAGPRLQIGARRISGRSTLSVRAGRSPPPVLLSRRNKGEQLVCRLPEQNPISFEIFFFIIKPVPRRTA